MGYRESTWERRTCAGLAKTKRFLCCKLCESVWSNLLRRTNCNWHLLSGYVL